MRTIDGQILKQMLISGSNSLYNHYPEIDALNVFPIPDGDTGINMNLTLTSGIKEIENRKDTNIHTIAKLFSSGVLMGTRGNSGAITSQIFRGFAKGLEGKTTINVVDFAYAMQKGVEVAYKAVKTPVEGTILTVVRESSQALFDKVKENMTFEKAMDILVNEATLSLKRTPELLPILKEVGVVDSGATGLLEIYKGMQSVVNGGFVERVDLSSDENAAIKAAGASMEEEEFGYCTEFIMLLGPDSTKKKLNENRFNSYLESKGNSVVFIHDEDIVKVHVHTMVPGEVLTYAQQFGEFLKLKIENMTEQHHALLSGEEVVTSQDLVEEKPLEKYAMIGVSSGEGIDGLFKEAGINYVVKGGQTMNPSSEDFITAIRKAHAKTLYIFPNNSNIVMAASQAAEFINEEGELTVFVIPSKTIPQGIAASIMFNPEATPEENFREMKSALKNVKSGEITYSIRDSEINGVKIKKGDYIGIFEKDIVCDNPNKVEAAISLVKKMVDDDSALITVLVGEDVTEEESNTFKHKLEELYVELDFDFRKGNQPVYSFLVGVE